MHIYCPTSHAAFLAGAKDEAGVLRFPSDGALVPGVFLKVQARTPIHDQLVQSLQRYWPELSGGQLDVVQEFSESFTADDQHQVTLYLATLADKWQAAARWASFPDLLKSMAHNRSRLPYLKAWQVLAGGLQLNTKAVDAAELKNIFDS